MNSFFLLFIGLPALELFLMIEIGGRIGALNTIGLIFLTAIIGIYFAKIQSIQTLKSGMINIYQNKLPVYELLSGAALAFAAILLIVPGFATDLIGFLIIFPPTRKFIFKKINNQKTTKKFKKEDFSEGESEDIDDNKK